MKITIDFNNDNVMINPDERYEDAQYEIAFSELKRGNKIQSFLEELINAIAQSTSDNPGDGLNVELESLNEEHRETIGEW